MNGSIQRTSFLVLILIASLAVALIGPDDSYAVHESDTDLTFEPVADSPSPAGAGDGTIEFRGEAEPESRWTATFRFTGLQPEAEYVTVVQGRFGEDGSAEAAAFTSICGFRTNAAGDGGCWYYLVGLRRLSVMQVRLGDENGQPVVQATRDEEGLGSMTSTTNAHSLELTATPLGGEGHDHTATPAATP